MAEVTAVKIHPYNFSDPQLCSPGANELLPSEYRKRLRTRVLNITTSRFKPATRSRRNSATDLSANYLDIHHANNRRKRHRSHQKNPRSEHSQSFTFDKRYRFIQRNSYPPRD
ncbi:hypothetical protein TNIN_422781 [Trichonephila inaurata madagascariensis]|uniref:Uncharacterized protein n=1 Tax=Trichonephila inaurata madagascariensis TaxID=2747483 RepID=A0A8X6WY79_9ARAC|nr:hypothetical protein TNIN_422781 [Trichonephila inaurata madagascariensis]